MLSIVMMLSGTLIFSGCSKPNETIDNNDNWVDLGLPSGLLWAKCNVGADSPEEYGDYFAWGETAPKEVYGWRTYKYCNASTGEYTRYNGKDGLFILLPEDDAATVNMGGGARTPTLDEWQELIDNTTIQVTVENGVSGLRFSSSNGNRIFLPAAGENWNDSPEYVGRSVSYWSSSLEEDPDKIAWYYEYSTAWSSGDDDEEMALCDITAGLSVRAVCSAR